MNDLQRSSETQALLKKGKFPNPMDIRVLDEEEFYKSRAYLQFKQFMEINPSPNFVFFDSTTVIGEQHLKIGSDLAEIYAEIRQKINKKNAVNSCQVM
jgi:hypothetical protein